MRVDNKVPGFVERSSKGGSATMHLRVLGYREDGDWCALCLEMDLRGYGSTFDEATDDLRNAIVSQFTFAMQMNNADLLAFSAERKYHDIFAHMLHVSMRRYLTGVHVQEAPENKMICELPVPSLDSLPRGAYATT